MAFTMATNIIATIAYPERKHDSKNGCELVEGNEKASEFRGREFCIVKRALVENISWKSVFREVLSYPTPLNVPTPKPVKNRPAYRSLGLWYVAPQ